MQTHQAKSSACKGSPRHPWRLQVHCGWTGGPYQRTTEGLAAYEPLLQLLQTVKVEDASLPFTYSLAAETSDHDSFTLNSDCSGVPSLGGMNLENPQLSSCQHPPALLCSVAFTPDEPTATPQQQNDLRALLVKHTDAFSKGKTDIGRVHSDHPIRHRIQVKPGSEPVCTNRPLTSFSHHEREFMSSEIAMLESLGVIRKSRSPWISSPVCVKKHDKTLRLCIDFRPLNAVTVPDPYPLPVVEHLLTKMSSAKYFSCMDIVSAFWQVPMHPDDIQYTGFRTPNGNYEWVRMPFGLVTASSTFQRIMDHVMEGLPFVAVYLDDVFIFSSTWEEHLAHIEIVLQRCIQYHIKLKEAKCIFGATHVKCLGHVVGGGLVSPDPGKLSAIVELPAPTDLRTLRSFLGMASYYRQYIESFAEIISPMAALTKKNAPFIWTPECQSAFETLKNRMTSSPVLRLPDFNKPFILTTDWSKVAIGAVLSQVDADTGFDHPVAFASRLLNAAECNYSPTEGELLALVWAVNKFRLYLDGRHFTAYTDHHALEWLSSARFQNSKLERWALRLQEYDFTVIYKKGEENLVADCLSRCVAAACVRVHAISEWPSHAPTQKALDDIPCTVCGDPEGHDNLVICDKCDRLFHLRCLIPPQSTVPSGEWLCPACDTFFADGKTFGLSELTDAETPLSLQLHDPYLDQGLLDYVQSGHNLALLEPFSPKRAVQIRRRGSFLQTHPSIPGWLLVYKKIRYGPHRWLVSPPLLYRWDIIRMFHDTLGHAGIEQTLKVLHLHYHWTGIKLDVTTFVACCIPCQKVKAHRPQPPLLQPAAIYGPLAHVHIDLAGPFMTAGSDVHGNGLRPPALVKNWIVVMIDYFTKTAEFATVGSKEPHDIARAFWDAWVCRYGVPAAVTSDNGPEFETTFTHMLNRLGIHHIHTSVSHPSANGVAERMVKTLKTILNSHLNDNPTHWKASLPTCRKAYMNRTHTCLGVSPNEMLYGFAPHLPLAVRDPLLSSLVAQLGAGMTPHEHVETTRQRLQLLDNQTYLRLRQQFCNSALQQARKLLPKRHQRSPLQAGDWVFEIGPARHALHSGIRGPFLVVQLDASGTHATLTTGATSHRAARTFTRHASHLVRMSHKSLSGGEGVDRASGLNV